jgi:hypothetical protein
MGSFLFYVDGIRFTPFLQRTMEDFDFEVPTGARRTQHRCQGKKRKDYYACFCWQKSDQYVFWRKIWTIVERQHFMTSIRNFTSHLPLFDTWNLEHHPPNVSRTLIMLPTLIDTDIELAIANFTMTLSRHCRWQVCCGHFWPKC